MRVNDVLLAAFSVATLFTATAAAAPDDLPGQPLDADHAYILTQQHRDNLSWWNGTWTPQTVRAGAHVQLQLPSDPTRWVTVRGRECTPSPVAGVVPTSLLPLRAKAVLVGRSTLPNEGRVPGSSELSVFDYRLHGVGLAAICLRPEPAPDQSQSDAPADYVVTLVVGVAQLSAR